MIRVEILLSTSVDFTEEVGLLSAPGVPGISRGNLSEAEVVTSHRLQDTSSELVSKPKQELRPGTRAASNTFNLSGSYQVRHDGDAKALPVL
jgi:hypothetical protein